MKPVAVARAEYNATYRNRYLDEVAPASIAGRLIKFTKDGEFQTMLYVVKNGKTIHSDKIAVGELRYATPIFSADMQTIIFNPEWTAPPIRGEGGSGAQFAEWRLVRRKLDPAAARTIGEI